MAKKYMIFVIDDLSGLGAPEEMKAIDAFNDQLRADHQWIFAWGLEKPETATVIDNRNGANLSSGKPFFDVQENFSGFWLIEADSPETAQSLAFQASKACNRKVELRPLH
ncbi:MAG: YciI family protein [Actinomycetes bacterium]